MEKQPSSQQEVTDASSRGNEALRLSEARFRALAETASDAIVSIDLNSRILFVNRAAEIIFGHANEEMVGRDITMLMPDYLRHVHKAALSRYNQTGKKHINWARTQLPGLHKDGHEIPVELSIAEHSENGEKLFTGILRDVTERVNSEKVLQRQTAVIQLLQNVAIAANQANTIGEAIIAALAQVCQHTAAQIGHAYFIQDGTPIVLVPSSLWYPPEADEFASFRVLTEATTLQVGEGLPGRVAATGKPVWIKDVNKDINFPRLQGAPQLNVKGAFAFPILVKGDLAAVLEFFSEEDKEPDDQVLGAAVSIGAQLGRVIERKRTEESLSKLSGRLLRSQDEERRRIGRELHDSAGQYLVALQMTLDNLTARLSESSSDPYIKEQVSESQDLAQRCLNEIRTLSYLLHPPLLEDAGLASTVRWYVEGFAKRSGVAVDVQIQPELPRLEPNDELALFRVVQESLTNIHRHSGSKTASLNIQVEDNKVKLQISDQGRGISKERGAKLPAGVGIAGMRERLSELGGVFQVNSNTVGTTVQVVIPMHPRPSIFPE